MCGIITEIRREGGCRCLVRGQMLVSVSCYVMYVVPDVGVYVFPCLTLLGFDKQDPVVARLQGLGVRLEDHDRRCEGLEVASSCTVLYCTVLYCTMPGGEQLPLPPHPHPGHRPRIRGSPLPGVRGAR